MEGKSIRCTSSFFTYTSLILNFIIDLSVGVLTFHVHFSVGRRFTPLYQKSIIINLTILVPIQKNDAVCENQQLISIKFQDHISFDSKDKLRLNYAKKEKFIPKLAPRSFFEPPDPTLIFITIIKGIKIETL